VERTSEEEGAVNLKRKEIVMEKCQNCKYFTGEKEGVCRRYPPVIVKKPRQGMRFRSTVTTWPRVKEGMWCGEWKALEE
jgi:hypothetical protein